MILVADCSALVALAICGSLDLLERLFEPESKHRVPFPIPKPTMPACLLKNR
jgi:hypothetical protein